MARDRHNGSGTHAGERHRGDTVQEIDMVKEKEYIIALIVTRSNPA